MESLTGKISSIVTAGSFDGVHCGHVAVLEHLKQQAAALSLTPVAVTFDRHPLSVIAPERAPKLICTPDERDGMIRDLGVHVWRVTFDENLRRLTAAEWMQLLRENVGMKMLITGYDHTFGSDGRGMSLEDYQSLGKSMGVEVISAPIVPGTSSSQIRAAIAAGDVAAATRMLGRPHKISGAVEHGQQIGRTIGFPTANLSIPTEIIIPGNGVYAAYAITEDNRRHRSIVNIGNRPTVESDGALSIEAHILDLKEDLYEKQLSLEFVEKIRDEQQFPTLENLRSRIALDMESAKKILKI
jgi:riboflavin kinase/FMN adenylyltransferase